MYSLLIKGFQTAEQVQAFWDWYEGQGEQDLSAWMDCQDNDIKYMDSQAPFQLAQEQDNVLSGNIKVTLKE